MAGQPKRPYRGPALYLGVGGVVGATAAIPLVAAIPIHADPNPLGYALVLLGMPTGGLVYRIRSRNWPVDPSARARQMLLSFVTLLLPIAIFISSGLSSQGFVMTTVGLAISGSVGLGIMLSGVRRQRSG